MVYWEWSSEMVVGIELIDKLQRELVGSTNHLFETLANGMPVTEHFGDLLIRLEQVTGLAFLAKEEVYQSQGTAQPDAHRAAHADFSRRILELQLRHHVGDNIDHETLQLLADWLAYHQVRGLGCWKSYLRALKRAA